MKTAAITVAVMAVAFASPAGRVFAHLGSPDLEPCLQGREDIVFFEDFEQASYYTHWGQSSAPGNVGRVGSPLFDGDWSLHIQVPQGQHTGIGWQFEFTDQGLAEPEEIYFRYYMYLGDNWRRSAGGEIGKLPGIAGTYGVAGWGGRPSHGDDGWSARMSNRDLGAHVEPGYYCYHADMTGIYGDNWYWGGDAYLDRQRWYCIETYCKMNSITGGEGNNDGILRGWVDGQLVFEKSNIDFRDVDRLKIEMIWFNVYVGGTWTAEQDMDAYFDNMVIAASYIGPRADWGDANYDGRTDGLDYNVWSLHYLQPGGWGDGNFNTDGVVDGLDYNIWSLHYEGGAGAGLPEPAATALLGLGGPLLLVGARRRRAAAPLARN